MTKVPIVIIEEEIKLYLFFLFIIYFNWESHLL